MVDIIEKKPSDLSWPGDFRNKVICGDGLETMRRIPSRSIDLVVTSPPYNLIREWSGGGPNSCRKSFDDRKKSDWYPDCMPEAEYQAWQKQCLYQMFRICRGSIFYNHKVRYGLKRRGRVYHPIAWLSEFPLWCEIIWVKSAPPQNVPRFKHVDERILQFGRPRVWNKNNYTTVWDIPYERSRNGHPCPFPVEIPHRCIETATAPGQIVLDPFCGTGTTAVAARCLGRVFIGIDRDIEYCRTAGKRIDSHD